MKEDQEEVYDGKGFDEEYKPEFQEKEEEKDQLDNDDDAWWGDEDDDWFEEEDDEDDEGEQILDSKQLMFEYLLSYPYIKNYLEKRGLIPRDIKVRILRAYALLQAYLSAEKGVLPKKSDEEETLADTIFEVEIKGKELYKFFSFENTKLPKISKQDLQEAIAKLKELPDERRDIEEMEKRCQELRLQKNRLKALNQLMKLRHEANQCWNAFGVDTKSGMFSWNLRYLVYSNLFNKRIYESIKKLDDIILGLMGSIFKRTFTKEELVRDYYYPDLTDGELYELHVDELQRRGSSDFIFS